MPIDYYHGTPSVYGLVGLQSGANQYAQQQLQNAVQQQELAQRQQQLDQNYALQAAQFGENQRQFDLQQQMEASLQRLQDRRNRENQQRQEAQNWMNQQATLYGKQMDYQQQLMRDYLANQQNQENAYSEFMYGQLGDEASYKREMSQGAVQNINDTAKEMLSSYRKMNLNDEGRMKFAELSGQLENIRAQQATMTPEQYTQAMGDQMRKIEEANLADFIEEPMNGETMKKNGMMDLPAGYGYAMFPKPDGSMEFRPIPPAKQQEQKPDPSQITYTIPGYGKITKPEFDMLESIKESQRKDAEAARDYAERIQIQEDGDKAEEPGYKPKPSNAAINKARKFYGLPELDFSLDEPAQGGATKPPPNGQPAPPPPLPAATPTEEVIEPQMPMPEPVTPEETQAAKPVKEEGELLPPAKPPEISVESAIADPKFKGYFNSGGKLHFKATSVSDIKQVPPLTTVVLPDGRTFIKAPPDIVEMRRREREAKKKQNQGTWAPPIGY